MFDTNYLRDKADACSSFLCYDKSMSKEIIPNNTKSGRALKAITRFQIATAGLAVSAILIDVLPVVFHWVPVTFPVFSMAVMPIGFGVIVLSVIVEVIIIISALAKKHK